jgi:hypothetical protein
MGFVTAYDNPRTERCMPESNGASPETWTLDTCMEEDREYWVPVQDLHEQYDLELNDDAFDIADAIVSMQQYLKMRKQIQVALRNCVCPNDVYAVVAKIPPDFFETEDNLTLSKIWFDGTPLRKSFYTIEDKCEALLDGFRRKQRSHTQTVKVFSKERAIQPVLAKKGGKILRPQTAEQLQALIGLGFTIYVQKDVAYAT